MTERACTECPAPASEAGLCAMHWRWLGAEQKVRRAKRWTEYERGTLTQADASHGGHEVEGRAMTDIDTGPLMAAVRRYAGPWWYDSAEVEAAARELARRYAEEQTRELREALAEQPCANAYGVMLKETGGKYDLMAYCPADCDCTCRPCRARATLAALKEQT